MEIGQLGNKISSENKPPKYVLKKEAGASIDTRDAFKPSSSEGLRDRQLKEMVQKGTTKKAMSEKKTGVMDVIKSGAGGATGLIGGALGLIVGGVYDATVLGPIYVAYLNQADKPEYLKEMVRQFASPVTLAVKGAKAGYQAGVSVFEK